MENINNILVRYLQLTNGYKCFIGNPDTEQDLRASIVIAEACSCYQDDDSEELYADNLRSCFNCKYRRWIQGGFNCFKNFLL